MVLGEWMCPALKHSKRVGVFLEATIVAASKLVNGLMWGGCWVVLCVRCPMQHILNALHGACMGHGVLECLCIIREVGPTATAVWLVWFSLTTANMWC